MKNIWIALCLIVCLMAMPTSSTAEEKSDDPLPKVLLIGDSISNAYTSHVKQVLKGQATVVHHKGNAGPTTRGLEKLDDWLGKGGWDVIHFNWGLHDLCYRHPKAKPYGNRDKINGTLSTPLVQYEKNLDQLVGKLNKTGAKLIWAHTTVVPEGEAGRFVGDAVKYNAVATKIMKKHGIVINDLHALTKTFDKDLFSKPGDVHYTTAGSRKIAHQVATAIKEKLANAAGQADDKKPATRQTTTYEQQWFEVDGRPAFVIEPTKSALVDGRKPWVWYAITLRHHYPKEDEQWMFDQFLAQGIAIAGVDVGESYGSPKGRASFQSLYEELTTQRNYSQKPVLFARSRGGLMIYNWAVEHPQSISAIAGIYPVSNIASYPGLAQAAPAYEMTADELKAELTKHNPNDRLAPAGKSKCADLPYPRRYRSCRAS